MGDLELARGAVAAIIGLFGLWITGAQLTVVFLRRRSSLVPLFGGGFAAVGLLIAPEKLLHQLWWVPIVLDPGCALMVLCFFWALATGKYKNAPTPPSQEGGDGAASRNDRPPG